jgi:hypothetical protein
MRFILYSRSYCHLCEDMLNALRAADGGADFDVEVVDVDANPALLEHYDELVPVLVGQKEGQEAIQICHYFLDVVALQTFIDGVAAS